MKVPAKKDETTHNVRHSEFVSPNIDDPQEGSMIATTVRTLAPCIRNFIMETPGTLVVPSPYDIVLPPLRVCTFVQVTGRAIARTVGGSDIGPESTKSMESPGSEPPAKKQKTIGGPGSPNGKVPPDPPKVKGRVADDDGENAGEDEVVDADDSDDGTTLGGDADGDDLNKLEALEAELESKKPPPSKRARKKGWAKTKAAAKAKPKAKK